MSCGAYHTVGLRADGTLWAWGKNTDGQLGDGTNVDSNVPVQQNTGEPEEDGGGGV